MILFRPFHLSLSIFNMIKDSNLVIPLVEIFSHIQLNVIYNPFKYITTDMDYQNSKRHALKNISYMPFHNFCQIHNGKRTQIHSEIILIVLLQPTLCLRIIVYNILH